MAIISFDKNLSIPYVPKCDRENMGKDDVCVVWLKTSSQGNSDLIRARGLRKTKAAGIKLENGEIDNAILTAEMKQLFIENVGKIENYTILTEDGERAVKDSAELYEVAEPDFVVDILTAIQKKSVLDEGQKKT